MTRASFRGHIGHLVQLNGPVTALTSLATRLGVAPGELGSLTDLDATSLATLDAAVAAALASDAKAVAAGIEATLRLVPFPLRGRAAKALGV